VYKSVVVFVVAVPLKRSLVVVAISYYLLLFVVCHSVL
jgi:hypothetical protein